MEENGRNRALSHPAAFGLLMVMTLVSVGVSHSEAPSVVVTGPSTDIRIAEGDDYSVVELGNRWDMDCPGWSGDPSEPPDSVWDERFTCDISWTDSRDINGESFGSGVYQGTAASDNPWFWLAHPGRFSTIRLAKGSLFPINTSKYRHLTAKVRYGGAATTPAINFNFFGDHEGDIPAIGRTIWADPRPVPGTWTIISFDLWDPATYFSAAELKWKALPVVRGLRVNPTYQTGDVFELDWVRLTADPSLQGMPDSTAAITWSASGTGSETFSIEAVDSGGARFELVDGLPAGTTSDRVDFSRLPPGAYAVRVRASGGASGTSFGHVLINESPILHFTEPDKRGDTEHAYSKVVACPRPGDPTSCYDWDEFDEDDIYHLRNATVSASAQPPVTIKSEAVCSVEPELCTGPDCVGDPYFPLMTCLERNPAFPSTHPDSCYSDRFALIDTDKYRMFTYKMEISGERGCGNVARVVWGNSLVTPLVSDDIDVQGGLNTYVIGDLDALWLGTGLNNGPGGHWNGLLKYFRFDPHEYWDARTTQLHSFTLAPVDTADLNGDFNIEWLDSDSDDVASIDLYYDADQVPGSGNEILIVSGLLEGSASSYSWDTTAPSEVVPGEYYLFSVISDSLNTTARYASGPLRVPGLRAQSFSGGVNLTWTDSASEQDYRVMRRRQGTLTFDQIAILVRNTTVFEDRTALAGVTYEYQIVACNGAVCEAPMNIGPVAPRALKYFSSADKEREDP